MPKKSKSSAKKKRKEKKLEPITETIEENKAFKFEFDEFIIENAPEHIKMFAKPDASLHGEKQFQVKITKDETGKAQFDIKFIKSPEEDNGLGRVSSVPSDSDKGQVTAIVISPDENKLDLINAPSFPQQVEPSTAMSGNLNDRNIHRSQNIFQLPNQPPHDRNKSAGNNTYKNNHHNRYYNIRSQLLNEENEAAYPRIHPDNSRTNNTQEQLLTNVNMEYVPNDFFTSTDSFISSTPLETKSKRFPILQLKGDETEPYIVEDAQGKQFLVKPILYTKHHDAGEPSTSKYVPKGEPKKSGKKNDQTPNGMPYLQHIGVGSESHITKNTGCGSKDLSKDSGEVLKTDAGTSTDPMGQLKETEARQTFDQAMKAETERYIDQAKERTVDNNNNASPNDNVSTETLVDETPLNTLMQPDETKWNSNAQSTSSITSHKTFPSEWNFVITSACQNYPEKKQQQMKDIVSEILDYFDTDLIKGLMAQKIEEEREFIIKYMNHKGKYGLKKMEFINEVLRDKTLCENEDKLIQEITARILKINESIMELLDHKVYDENAKVGLIVEKQLEKSKPLIMKETCAECFLAIKYCTLQILQDHIRRENKLMRKEVELNLKKELEMTLMRIKSICSKCVP